MKQRPGAPASPLRTPNDSVSPVHVSNRDACAPLARHVGQPQQRQDLGQRVLLFAGQEQRGVVAMGRALQVTRLGPHQPQVRLQAGGVAPVAQLPRQLAGQVLGHRDLLVVVAAPVAAVDAAVFVV